MPDMLDYQRPQDVPPFRADVVTGAIVFLTYFALLVVAVVGDILYFEAELPIAFRWFENVLVFPAFYIFRPHDFGDILMLGSANSLLWSFCAAGITRLIHYYRRRRRVN